MFPKPKVPITIINANREVDQRNAHWAKLNAPCSPSQVYNDDFDFLLGRQQQPTMELVPEKKEIKEQQPKPTKEKKETFQAKYNKVCKEFEEFKKSIQNPKYEAKAVPYNPYILFEKPRIKSQRVKETFTTYEKPKYRFVSGPYSVPPRRTESVETDSSSSSSSESEDENEEDDSEKPKPPPKKKMKKG